MSPGRSGGGSDEPGKARLYQVTMLFSDLSGYTALLEASDPEDVDALRQALANLAEAIIDRHGGVVSQFYGDGVLAVFGLPAPHEEDARRAVEAALELHESVRALPLGPRLPSSFKPRMHSGIETGVVLAREGNLRNGKYELTGDAVNTAARMCAAAQSDHILVGRTTLQGLEPLFDLETIPPLSIDGKQKTVAVYRVFGRSKVRTRFEARARRGLTPLIGRAQELDCLRRVLSDAIQGRLRLAAVVGDAGIGKTRLLEEFVRWAAISDANIYRVTCEADRHVAPFQPFLNAVRQVFGLHPDLPADRAITILESSPLWAPDQGEHVTTLLHLLSLRLWKDKKPGRSSDDAQRAIIAALTALFSALAAQRSLVLIVDDWQWADDASRQVLHDVVQALEARAAMILVASRPVAVTDVILTDAETIRLEPFTEDESIRAIHTLVPAIPDLGLSAAIHRRSGGNPLFLEELCHSLPAQVASSGEGLGESGVPSTIHGLIKTRFHRLPEREARLLRIASVIGNEIPFWLLERLSGLDSFLPAAMAYLAGENLIYRTEHDSTFRFKHEITRDGVYQLVGQDERRRVHGDVARALEERFHGQALADQYEALAYHYARSDDHGRALEYADLAGDKAAGTSALDRARWQYRAALTALDRMMEGAPANPERSLRWLTISMKWAATCVFSPAAEQLAILQRGADCAHALNDPNAIAHAEYWLGWIHYALGAQDKALLHYQRALAHAADASNQRLKAQLLSNMGQSYAAAGDYDPALRCLADGIAMKRAVATSSGVKRALPVGFAYALACAGMVHADRGAFQEAEQCLDEAMETIGRPGHAVEGSLLGARALTQLWQGRWRDCLQTAMLTLTAAERLNVPYVFAMTEMVGGYARWMLERTPGALAQLRRAVDWLEGRGMRLYLSCNYAYLAEALAMDGQEEPARDYALRALQRAAEKDPIGEASAYRTLARLSAGKAGTAGVELLAQATASAQRRASRRELALTGMVGGELALAAGDRHAARQELASARDEFQRMQMVGYEAEASRLLGL